MQDKFLLGLSENQLEVTEYLHRLFTENYNLESNDKYEIPFYSLKSWICYINPIKNDTVELAFTRGIELVHQADVLNFKGRKQVGGFDLKGIDYQQLELVEMVLQDAIILDYEVPYKSKRKKNN
ncbi:MAG: hypothetical protein P8M34_14365 [Saprospiraceae bacterium]|nr:hypothetical protein [Saprospiraceae bacterium]